MGPPRGLCLSEHTESLCGESLEEYDTYLNKVSGSIEGVLRRTGREGRPIPLVTPCPRPRDPDVGRMKHGRTNELVQK